MNSKANGKQGAKPALTPILRFPEFRDGPVWKDGKVGELVSTVTPPKKLPTSSYLEKGSFPIIDQSQREICGWTNDDKAVIATPLPLIVFGDHTCALKFITQPFAQGADGIKILNARNDVGNEYLFHFLNFQPVVTEEYKRHFSILQEKRVSFSDIKIGEQQKIADCLTSLDKLIAAQSQKLDALKTHKKGLMQQLLPREGETLPRLRFPEFQDEPTWKSKKSGELFAHRVESGEADLPIYSVTMNDGMVRRSSLDRHVDDIADPGANKKALKDDIAYNMMRMWQGAFGVAREDCMVSPAYVVLAPRKEVYSEFFEYLLKLPSSLRLLTANSQGLTKDRLRLYYKDFSTIPLPHPSFAEQKRIADCLTSIDDLITAQSAKLATLKTHKKGLMQQLFPSPAAVEA